MHRFSLRLALPISIALAALLLAGCGTTAKHVAPTLTFPEPSAPACHPRNPPSMGECVAQKFGIKPNALSGPLTSTGNLCVDVSQWQGYYPNFTGLRCVILQASYGLNVEPSIYSQIRDANEHHIPWGAYTYMEGNSGAAEARFAINLTNGRGRTLGVWADAEIGAAYSHACEYTREAQALGLHIYGLYTSPGLWPGGRCVGYLWPAEWGSGVYAFGGYPYSAVKLQQFSGTSYRYGVATDLDVDLGLVALSKPAPPPRPPTPVSVLRARLYRDYAIRNRDRGLINAHVCRLDKHGHGHEVPHTHVIWQDCRYWLEEGQDAVDEINILHRHGVR